MTQPLLATEQGYPIVVGRYALFDPIASGGMASVHIGRLVGSFGFARTVAIKRLHQNMARDPEFLAMFLDEARVAARIRHPNVVPTLDVVALESELLLVMEYVSGAALSRVIVREREAGRPIPHRIAVDIMIGVLNGLHAAHEATNEDGEPLEIVHRDVSPQNILVGTDGIARVLDFGIAKAVGGANLTRPNQIKGKLRYLSPESVASQPVTRASDIFAASIVLWEMLTGQRLFDGTGDGQILMKILNTQVVPPSRLRPHISSKLDDVVMCGLARDPRARHATARDMAVALEAAVTPVSRSAVSEWLTVSVGDEIRERDARVAHVEREVRGDSTLTGHGPPTASASLIAQLIDAPIGVRPASSESSAAPSQSLVMQRPKGVLASKRMRRQLALLGLALATCSLVVGVVALRARARTALAEQTALVAASRPQAPRAAFRESSSPPADVHEQPITPTMLPEAQVPAHGVINGNVGSSAELPSAGETVIDGDARSERAAANESAEAAPAPRASEKSKGKRSTTTVSKAATRRAPTPPIKPAKAAVAERIYRRD